MKKTIYDLELNETLVASVTGFGIRHNITRVASGWIYQPINRGIRGDDIPLNPVFVPFPAEVSLPEFEIEENE